MLGKRRNKDEEEMLADLLEVREHRKELDEVRQRLAKEKAKEKELKDQMAQAKEKIRILKKTMEKLEGSVQEKLEEMINK